MQLTPEQFHILYDNAAQPILLVQHELPAACNPPARQLLPPRFSLAEVCDPTQLQTPGLIVFRLGEAELSAICQPVENGALLFLSPPAQQTDPAALTRAAHAIAGPLTTLLSASGTYFPQLCKNATPAMRKALAAVNRACYQLLRLQENLNTFCAIQRGTLSLSREKLDLVAFLRTLRQTIEDPCRQTGHTLSFDLPSVPVYLWADARQLRRALLALISNALKFAKPDTPLRLSLVRQPQRAVIRLCDTGEGIDSNTLRTIFQRYRRPFALEDPRFGPGFSLPVVQAIVQAHGGTMLLHSEKNVGTDLLITLPLTRPNEPLVLRSPRVNIDRTGGFVTELVELSDALPPEVFDPLDRD